MERGRQGSAIDVLLMTVEKTPPHRYGWLVTLVPRRGAPVVCEPD
jgi:hypothetical protein